MNRRSHCNGWSSRCLSEVREIRHAEAVSSLLRHHQTSSKVLPAPRDQDLILFNKQVRFLEAEGSRHQPIYPIYGKISEEKRDRLERQGLLLLSDSEVDNRVADMGTPIARSLATNSTADTFFTSRV